VSWSFQWLCPARAVAAAHLAAKLPESVAALRRFGLLHQMQEALVKAVLLGQLPENSPYRQDLWQWYADPGTASLAGVECMSTPPVPDLTSTATFSGRYMTLHTVKDLQEHVLYSSTGWQTVLIEFLSVDHQQKTVTGYQVSTIKPQHKGSTIDQLNEVLKGLQLKELGYTLRLVYIMDASTPPEQMRGWAFEDEDGSKNEVADLEGVEGFVVRAPITPDKEHHVSSLRRMPKVPGALLF
jgi:hypothetical protein